MRQRYCQECSKPLKFKELAYFYCPSCGGEWWPHEDEVPAIIAEWEKDRDKDAQRIAAEKKARDKMQNWTLDSPIHHGGEKQIISAGYIPGTAKGGGSRSKRYGGKKKGTKTYVDEEWQD